MHKTRVLVVEDSLTVRKHLARILSADPEIELVGEAGDGKHAIEICRQRRPDVITMDMILPVMSGLSATEYIMAHWPTPILVVSSSTNRGELFKTYDALAAGAVDVLEKPTGTERDGEWESRFVSTVKLVSRIRVITHVRARRGVVGPPAVDDYGELREYQGPRYHRKLVAIGASTGGPSAIVEVLRGLPRGFPLPVLLVLHISEPFGTAFAEWLDGQTIHPVACAKDGAPIALAAGQIVMAPPGRHLAVRDGRLRLTLDAERHSCRPSVDVLFESVAREYGPASAACLLTGMGRDGAAGLLEVRRAGGLTIAQDEASCVVYGMPREAVLLGAVDRVLPLGEIGSALASLAITGGEVGGMTDIVLIVDDSLTVRMDLAEAFADAGFQIQLCATAAAARERLAAGPVAVVVLDVLLPDGDGIDLLKEVRASPTTASAIVLILSTEAEVRDRLRGLQTGADEYVGKPYDANYVVRKARELLGVRHGGVGEGRATILIIDDSATVRNELRQACEHAGYAVLAAADGEEGLRIAALQRPTAIVVDGMLPGIDGATVIRRVRLDAALRAVPCMLLTASDDHGAELQALEAGADAFVRKADDVELILARLEAMLRRVAAAGADDGPSLLGPKRILAVDDSITHLQEVAGALRDEGYDVVLAASGEEALQLLAVQPVDCILLDVLMPGLGGEETCRHIKAVPAIREIPLIMLTAHEDRQAMLHCLAAGADDYIQKSSEFEVLKARVRAQIRRRQFEDENRRIREELLQTERNISEARAARESAEARALHFDEVERKNEELEAFSGALTSANDQLRQEIAERLKTEEQLRQAQKMEAVGQLTGGIAHEFNNLLTIVLGHLDFVLLKTVDQNVAGKVRIAVRSAERGARLTSQLLAFGRRQALRLQAVDLNNLVIDFEEMLGSTVTSAVKVEKSLAPNLWPALADSSQIELALINLTLNARDAMPSGGTLLIQTRNISADNPERPDDLGGNAVDFVALTARDTGTGMTEGVRSKAFEPFFTTKDVGKGSGLGLSMVYGLAKQLGGTARIVSEPGHGASVTIYLPRAAAPVAAPVCDERKEAARF